MDDEEDLNYTAIIDDHEDDINLDCGCRLYRPFDHSGQPRIVGLTFCEMHANAGSTTPPTRWGDVEFEVESHVLIDREGNIIAFSGNCDFWDSPGYTGPEIQNGVIMEVKEVNVTHEHSDEQDDNLRIGQRWLAQLLEEAVQKYHDHTIFGYPTADQQETIKAAASGELVKVRKLIEELRKE